MHLNSVLEQSDTFQLNMVNNLAYVKYQIGVSLGTP